MSEQGATGISLNFVLFIAQEGRDGDNSESTGCEKLVAGLSSFYA